MFKKLRNNLVVFSTLTLFALLLLLLGSINMTNFILVASDADKITYRLSINDGSFPINDRSTDKTGPYSSDTAYTTRYFTAVVEDNVVTIKENQLSAYTEIEMKNWALSIKKNRVLTGWSKTYYRYRMYNKASEPNTKYITVIDQSRELIPLYRVLIGSSIGGVLALGIGFVIIFFASKKIVEVLEDNTYKQRRFIESISHELTTPLAVISSNNEILEIKHKESEETAAINKEVGRLKTIITNMNALLDSEQKEKNMQEFSLSNLGNDICASYLERFKTAQKGFDFEIEDNLLLKGNEEKIKELLGILLENAYQYATKKAYFAIKKTNERIVIEERNDMKGIRDGSLETVFKKFYRGDHARSSGVEGSGMGLSIAKQIVLTHNVRIYARGEKGEFIIKVEL